MAGNAREVIDKSDIVVLGNDAEEVRQLVKVIDDSKIVLDLVRFDKGMNTQGNYVGLAW
jgi:hypothetical protein